MNSRVVFIMLILLFIPLSYALNIDLFYGKGCPHCAAAEKWLNENSQKYNISIDKYEVYFNETNLELLNKRMSALGENVTGVPVIIIGNKTFVGWGHQTANEIIIMTGHKTPKYSRSYYEQIILWICAIMFLIIAFVILRHKKAGGSKR